MEGPSLVIAKEDLKDCIGLTVRKAEGYIDFKDQDLELQDFVGEKLRKVVTWGKHFILQFDSFTIRIHFLLFGSYKVDQPRPNRNPKLAFFFSKKHALFMYACSVKKIEEPLSKIYDWETDLMSPKWRAKTVETKISEISKKTMACDVLMNQMIFTGLGNIMKNEVLYRTRIHPEKQIGKLSKKQLHNMTDEAHVYADEFYRWKKKGQLKKHWFIMRKKVCPKGHKVTNKITGVTRRMSHFCKICQPL